MWRSEYFLLVAMVEEQILIVAKGCPACAEAEKLAGNLRVLDITENNEAALIAMRLDIRAVPVLVSIDREANRVCVIGDERKAKCVPYLEDSP